MFLCGISWIGCVPHRLIQQMAAVTLFSPSYVIGVLLFSVAVSCSYALPPFSSWFGPCELFPSFPFTASVFPLLSSSLHPGNFHFPSWPLLPQFFLCLVTILCRFFFFLTQACSPPRSIYCQVCSPASFTCYTFLPWHWLTHVSSY